MKIRRQVLIPLWNSYAFFVNYAVADEFDPTLEPVPLAERPERSTAGFSRGCRN
ncbi:MAG: hypothetical protein R3B91_20525 [Planctomycetaceae bacterium]